MQANKRINKNSFKGENRFPGMSLSRSGTLGVKKAVRRGRRKSTSFTIPILRHTARIKIANLLIKSAIRGGKKTFGIARTVQKARLSSRRKFFTSDDVKRAVYDTNRLLRKKRRKGLHGK